MTNTPLISVLMPVYNGEAYLREAIDSILGQTFTDFEFLIINDGSTDGTKDIILSYTDPRIRYIENEQNLKLIATLNKGIDLCQGKYIARMDADDVSVPERLQKQVEYMEANVTVGILGTGFTSYGSSSKETCFYPSSHDEIATMLVYQTTFSHPTVMIRTSVLRQHNVRFDPEFLHAEDFELWIRLIGVTKGANLQESLLNYRMHDTNISKQYADIQERNTVKAIGRYLTTFGATLNDDQVRMLRQICYQNFFTNEDELYSAKTILETIFTSRETPPCIRQFVSHKWLHLCLNSGLKDRTLFQSLLLKHPSISWKDRLKLRVKALL